MVLRWALLAVLAPICLAQYDYQVAPRPQPRPPPPRPPPPPPPADDPYGAPAPPAPQPPPPTPVQIVQKCPDCPAPQVVVVVPEQQPAIPTNLFTQQLMMQALGFGGLNSLGSGNQQQQMQTMAMMHLMQAQGMSYYQQMQMLGMMQMAKRFGGRPVPLQPVFRTTAEYSYPGKKIVFWPPYISARPKEVVRPAPAPAPSGYGPEPQPQIETSQYNSNQESTNIPDISQTFPQPPSGLAYDKGQAKKRHA